MLGEKPGDEFGVVKRVGDVNGDGYEDVAVGMKSFPYTSEVWGMVWILAGKFDEVDIGTGDEQLVYKTIPKGFALEQHYPNPFNRSTTIKYCLANKLQQKVMLMIYDLFGKDNSLN